MNVLYKTVLLFVCIITCSHAQFSRNTIDSLSRELRRHRAEDTVRVQLLLDYSGSLYFTNPDTSIMRYADEALRISQSLNWKKGIAVGLGRKGTIYHFLYADPIRALSYYQQAITINEELKNKKYTYQLLANTGIIYTNLKEYKKGLAYHQQAYAILKTLPDQKEKGQMLYIIGRAYYEMKDFQHALPYLQRSLTSGEKEGNNYVIANALSGLGVVAVAREDFQLALAYLQRSLAITDSYNYVPVKMVVLMNLAVAYKGLKQYEKAERYAKNSLTIAKTISMMDIQQQAWGTLAEVYQEQNRYKQSLDAYVHYQQIKDSLITDDKKLAVTRQEMQFAQEKREAVLTTQHTAELKQQQTERNAALGGSGLLLLAGTAGFALYKRKREADEQTKEAELKADMADTEMKALRAQMNPHFIFNSLNSIGDYIIKHDTESADYYLTKFAKLMRLILENSEQNDVSLTDDLQALELYMQLEAMRVNNRFTYDIHVDEAINPDETFVPPLLLQPFVENSIWHGLAHKPGVGHITVTIRKEGDMINCMVEDNGVGRREAAIQEKQQPIIGRKSLGMKITNSRIALLNRRKKAKAAVSLSDLSEGTRVEVKLPLELSF